MISTYPKAKRIYLIKLNKIIDYKIIKEFHETRGWDINFMCKDLGISRASYYKWLNKKETDKELEDRLIVDTIKEISESNNSLFGIWPMTYTVNKKLNKSYNHKRIYRLMCINDIKSNFRKKSTYQYIRSTPEQTAENILSRDFSASKPNEKWCTDITEIKVPTTNYKLYISPILDLYDRFPVALSVSERNDSYLTNDVFNKAIKSNPGATPLFHSDRGFQYTREVFHKQLESLGIKQSMSRVSKCIDNGPCEGFQGIFKEMISILYPNVTTKEEMIEAIYKTLDYYINEYPQKRFKGKTAGEVRKEALATDNPIVYPILKNNKILKYWEHIEELKQAHSI